MRHLWSQVAFAHSATTSFCMPQTPALPPAHVSDIIQMALSDHVSFQDIRREYGIGEKDVKALMRDNLKPGSYRAWRKRVRDFGDRRETYK
ncbi:uncharacterized protein (TIGR03643 family) [Yoonia maricola]|uniref:Uncharacterized protein (TIGR03643 family) n=2 Tax=Yoonia maricola TaxID=420999 RepID=A0A2M8W592_9RHOB|nr:uncharacterized protein (TIGR03643 family) [Yoonia maricola]